MKKTKKDDIMKEKAFYVEDDVMANNQIYKEKKIKKHHITSDKKAKNEKSR